jgi:hypothetical protein
MGKVPKGPGTELILSGILLGCYNVSATMLWMLHQLEYQAFEWNGQPFTHPSSIFYIFIYTLLSACFKLGNDETC